MDNNTFQLGLAAIATIQAIVLAWIGYEQARTKAHVRDIANGLTTSKNAAIAVAALKTGELAGRDYEAAKMGVQLPDVPPATLPEELPK